MNFSEARYYTTAEKKRCICNLCPRQCSLGPDQTGLCAVRRNIGGKLYQLSWGQTTGFAVDPIEKKPLYHFLPGTRTLSFGTIGCNLTCRFCQNWQVSRNRSLHAAGTRAMPGDIAALAVSNHCPSVSFTYNDPAVFLEFALDTAEACHEHGIKTIAVTAGYLLPQARQDLFQNMDAANVDLKAFTADFYRRYCSADIRHVLDTLRYVRLKTPCWLEVTTLLLDGINDSDEEIRSLCRWIRDELGEQTPLHFTAAHPAYQLPDLNSTPAATLQRARAIGLKEGLWHVYTGNINDPEGSITICHVCQTKLLFRSGMRLDSSILLPGGICPNCTSRPAGVFI